MKLSKEAKETITDFFRFDRKIYLITFALALITLISHAATWFLLSNELFLNYTDKLPKSFIWTLSLSLVFVPLISLIGTLVYGIVAIVKLIGFYFFILISCILKMVKNK